MNLLTTVGLPALSVVSSATVAIGVKGMEVRSKRHDRDHALSLDLTKRIWDAKREALQTIVGACTAIKQQSQPVLTGPVADRAKQRRVNAVLALSQARDDLDQKGGLGAVLAWAEEPTRLEIEKLFDVIDIELAMHTRALRTIKTLPTLGISPDASDIEVKVAGDNVAIPKDAYERLTLVGNAMKQAEQSIGTNSRLNADTLIELCNNVIQKAYEDLRGKYGPNPENPKTKK